tara:strand:+ start:166 stop:801 length:636 start_codon:yes stop_codon:yes gene_type:complete
VPLSPSDKEKTFNALLLIDISRKAYEIDAEGAPPLGIGMFNSGPRPKVERMFEPIVLRTLMNSKVESINPKVAARLSLLIDDRTFSDTDLPTENEATSGDNPRLPHFDYSSIDNSLSPHILHIVVSKWGYSILGNAAFLDYTVTLVDTQSDKVIWAHELRSEGRFDSFYLADDDYMRSSVARDRLEHAVVRIFQQLTQSFGSPETIPADGA